MDLDERLLQNSQDWSEPTSHHPSARGEVGYHSLVGIEGGGGGGNTDVLGVSMVMATATSVPLVDEPSTSSSGIVEVG